MRGKGLRIPYIFLAIYCPTSYRIWFALYLIDKTLIYNVGLYPLVLYVIAHYQQWSISEKNELISMWKIKFHFEWKYWMALHAIWIEIEFQFNLIQINLHNRRMGFFIHVPTWHGEWKVLEVFLYQFYAHFIGKGC